MRIPHSELRGWDVHDVDLQLAYQSYIDGLGAHGFPMREAMSPAANPESYSGGYRYVAEDPVTDWAEKARLDRMDAYRESKGDNANLNGLVFPVRRVDYTPVEEGVSLEGL